MSDISTIKRNIAYQTIYQVLNTCIPLITSPYLARVLGAEKQGVFSYTQSIVNYFILFAMLGIVNYGTRTISECREDRDKRSRVFWSIYLFQVFLSITSLMAYVGYVAFVCNSNTIIAALQAFYLLGCLVDVSWLFFGVEQFDITVKRSIIVRLLSFASILLFVNSKSDLWIYTIIMSSSALISNAILLFYLGKIVDYKVIKQIKFKAIKDHIKPNIVLFIPLLAMSVYHIMDKTMLGLLSTYEQTGYYYNADKIINIPISIINGIGTVMLPRMTALNDTGKKDETNRIFNLSLELTLVASIAMSCGIAAISKEFTPVFFGVGFEPCVYLIIVLAPVLIIKSMSQTSRTHILIPQHKEKIFIESVFMGAIVNFIVNFILIRKYGAMGAVIGTLTAETVTCVWQFAKIKRILPYGKTLLKSSAYVIIGALMIILVRLSTGLGIGGVVGLFIEIAVGVVSFAVLCICYWGMTKNPLFYTVMKKRN